MESSRRRHSSQTCAHQGLPSRKKIAKHLQERSDGKDSTIFMARSSSASRGSVKARRALVNGLKRRLVAENAQATSHVRTYNVFDRETSRYGTVTPSHTISVSGNDIVIDPARDDEGVLFLSFAVSRLSYIASFRTAARMRSFASSQSNGTSILGIGIFSASTK